MLPPSIPRFHTVPAKPKSPAIPQTPVVVVHGDDDFLVGERAREIIDAICPPEQRDTGLFVVDGAVDKAEEVERAVREVEQGLFTVSLFGDATTVWLKDASFLNPYKDPGRSAAAKAQVESLVAKLKAGAPGNRLVISSRLLDKRSATFKFFDKQADVAVEVFSQPKKTWEVDKAATQQATEWFAEAGIKAPGPILERFIQRTGADSRQIRNEIEKLATYAGDGEMVTEAMIDDLVSPSRDAILWDFSDAVGQGQLGRARALLHRLVFQRESPVALVIQLTNRMRELLVLRECMDLGLLRGSQWRPGGPPEAVSWLDRLQPDPRKQHPFRTKNLAAQAANYSVPALRAGRDLLVQTHERMVSTPLPQELLLDLAITRIIAAARRNR